VKSSGRIGELHFALQCWGHYLFRKLNEQCKATFALPFYTKPIGVSLKLHFFESFLNFYEPCIGLLSNAPRARTMAPAALVQLRHGWWEQNVVMSMYGKRHYNAVGWGTECINES
jgi:hypothetical protein